MSVRYRNFVSADVDSSVLNVAQTHWSVKLINLSDKFSELIDALGSKDDENTYATLMASKDSYFASLKVFGWDVKSEGKIYVKNPPQYVRTEITMLNFDNGRVVADISAGNLALLEGIIDQDEIPDLDNTHLLGSDDRALKEVHVGTKVRVGAASIVPPDSGTAEVKMPAEGGTMLTSADTAEEEAGCFTGIVCIASHGDPPSKLFGSPEGNAIILTEWEDGGTCTMVSPRQAYLDQLFGTSNIASDSVEEASITISGTTYTFRNLTKDFDQAGWDVLTADVPDNLTLDAFIGHIREVGSPASITQQRGGLVAQGGIYVGGSAGVQKDMSVSGTADLKGALNLAGLFSRQGIAQVLNNFNAAADPTQLDDSSKGYQKGSLHMQPDKGQLHIATDATEGAAVWKSFGNVWTYETSSLSGDWPDELVFSEILFGILTFRDYWNVPSWSQHTERQAQAIWVPPATTLTAYGIDFQNGYRYQGSFTTTATFSETSFTISPQSKGGSLIQRNSQLLIVGTNLGITRIANA